MAEHATHVPLGPQVLRAYRDCRGAILATTLLYKVSPSDPTTYAGVAVTLGAIALLASYIPVRRATAVDPVRVLRLE